MAAPTKLISASQPFQSSQGVVASLCWLRLTLSAVAEVISGGGQVTTEPLMLQLDANGKLTATAIWFVDEVSPSGLVYHVELLASNCTRIINDYGFASVTGGSFDLATAVFSGAPSGPTFSGAVLLTPTGNQTITTGNLTLATGNFTTTTGNITAGGTLSVATTSTLTGAVTASTSVTSPGFISSVANPAATGLLRGPNNSILVASRNAANNGDIAAVQVNSSNLVTLGSGPFIIPAASDTAVGKTTTDTLTNKTLGGAGSTTPDTNFNRLKATQGSALVVGDVGSLVSWGSTATVSAVTGDDSAGSITISSSGVGQALNAQFLLTFHDGTWTIAPTVLSLRGDNNAPTTGGVAAAASATNCTFVFLNGLPVAGTSYTFYFVFIGKKN